MKITYKVEKNDNNKELKYILKNRLYISSKLLVKLKLSHAIFVNENPEFVNFIVKTDDIILIDFEILEKSENKKRFIDKFEKVDKKLDILYEDEYLLIINKPANMPIHPSCDNYNNTLSNIVASYLEKQKIYYIHILTRLDKNTTGICIFAKHEYIQELFTKRKKFIDFKKKYLCIVSGIVKKDHDIIEKNIARKDGTIIIREVNENGDFAKTEYTVLKRNIEKNYTVLEIILHTGRTHQIRVHMSHIGHVLLGDELYGIEHNITDNLKYIDRQALHCKKISFTHPITEERITIKCPIPEDMKKLIN